MSNSLETRGKGKTLDVEKLVEGVRTCDRTALGRAITLVESRSPAHVSLAQIMLTKLAVQQQPTLRIGITGVPGVGKSTFIEALGNQLLAQGNRVAVIAVDPSSTVSGGSILGDKTRMETLVRNENCFIRPVPSKGILGGVAQNTMETIIVCEAAGFDVILVETVGVGQNEATVRGLVDFCLLLMLPNAGDNLQGIKRGIMELADHILINKADGTNMNAAKLAQSEYLQALAFLRPATMGWTTDVSLCSAVEQTGMTAFQEVIKKFISTTDTNGAFQQRRDCQRRDWFKLRLNQQLQTRFFSRDDIQQASERIEQQFLDGKVSLADGIEQIMVTGGL